MKKFFFLSAIALAFSGAAQKTGNTIVFPKGQKLEMTAQTKAVITQEVMGQSMDMNVNSTIVRSFDIEEVNNGKDLVKSARAGKWDIVISDLTMPERNGEIKQ